MTEEYNLVKVVAIGESNVGKTSFIHRFVHDEFAYHSNTTGIDFESKLVRINNGPNVKFQIWDTAGQERYRSLIRTYFRKTNVTLIAFDLTNLSSFINLEYWIEMAKELVPDECLFVLIGTKADSKDIQVDTRKIEALVNKTGITYFEVSAKNCTGVQEVFEYIIEKLNFIPSVNTDINIEFKLESDKKKGCKC
jgi:small GTP-binding protein